MLEDPEPGAPIEDGLKLALAPEGRPEALSATAELKPPAMVLLTVVLPEDPWAIDSDDGAAEKVKLGVPPPLVVTETSSIRNVVGSM